MASKATAQKKFRRNSAFTAAVRRFEKAVRDDAWKGSQHPGDIPAIEKELRLARERLMRFGLIKTSKDQI